MQHCQECGSEHADWAEACVFCGGDLGPEEPAVGADVEPDHGTADVDVSSLSPAQLNHLDLLLTAAEIPYLPVGRSRTVPSADVEEARELLELASEPDDDDAGGGNPHVVGLGTPSDELPNDIRRLAVPNIRGWAQLLNGGLTNCLLSLVLVPVAAVAGSVANGLQPLLLIGANAGLTAVWGVDVGQFLCRLQVLDQDHAAPGLRRAMTRVGVVYGPFLVFAFGEWLAHLSGVDFSEQGPGTVSAIGTVLFGGVWFVALYVSIVRDPGHQGWHDRLAGTWVVTMGDMTRKDAARAARDAARSRSGATGS